MPPAEPEIAGVNLVFVGAMNPVIVQPAWLAAHDLIRDEEAEAANIQLIHPDVVSYALDWVTVEVTRDRCQLASTTAAESAAPVRDLAIGIFTILQHTPIRLVGINSDSHYRIDSKDQWHQIGHSLAPDSFWTGVLERPGMRSLLMEGARTDDHNGWVRATVEPSVRIHPGIYFAVNDHYDLTAEVEVASGAEEALGVIRDNWDRSIGLSATMAAHILESE